MEKRMLETGNGIDPSQLLGDRHADNPLGKLAKILRTNRRGQRLGVPVREVVAVPKRHGKCHANAHVTGSAGHGLGLVDHLHHALRIVTMVHRRDSATRIAGEGDRGTKIGINTRFLSEQRKPQFEGLVDGTNREGPQTAAVVMGVNERRHHEEPVIGAPHRRHRRNAAVLDRYDR
jgi:hypothetical protein